MSTSTRWFPVLERDDVTRPLVFCFPAAGGNTSVFYSWRTRLADRVQVVPVELPGHRSRPDEPPHVSVHSLVEELIAVMSPMADRPFTLLGTSMGALIAFEAARGLTALGHGCERLIVAACPAPRIRRTGTVHRLPDEEFVQRLDALGATPGEVLASAELRALFLPAWRADFTMVETYAYRPWDRLRSPITVVNADGDPHATHEEARAWRQETTGGFELIQVAGGHFFFLERSSKVLPAVLKTAAANGGDKSIPSMGGTHQAMAERRCM